MSDTETFIKTAVARQVEADTALHNGDATLRKAQWSTTPPVTLFGAVASATGVTGVLSVFDALAASFSECSQFEVEIVAAGVSGDIAYTVGYEHTSLLIDHQPKAFTLRVTHIYRREAGEWKIVHRHGDRLPEEVDSGLRVGAL